MDGQHSFGDWIANGVIVAVGWYTRLVFGKDKLNGKQTFAFLLLCGITVFVVDKISVNDPLKLSIMLVISMIIPSIVTGIIKGGVKSEDEISNSVEKNVKNISDKVNSITKKIIGNDKNIKP